MEGTNPIIVGLTVAAISSMVSWYLRFFDQDLCTRPQTDRYHKWFWALIRAFPRTRKAFEAADFNWSILPAHQQVVCMGCDRVAKFAGSSPQS